MLPRSPLLEVAAHLPRSFFFMSWQVQGNPPRGRRTRNLFSTRSLPCKRASWSSTEPCPGASIDGRDRMVMTSISADRPRPPLIFFRVLISRPAAT